jgi:CBS domain-containing protein
MSGDLIYAFRVMRLPLLDAGGAPIGRVEDLVVVPGRAARGDRPAVAPRMVGLVADSQRRRIFVSANRIGEINSDGVRLASWDVDLRPFNRRAGEVLIADEVLDTRIGDETVSDIALEPSTDGRSRWWDVAKVRLGRRAALGRRTSHRLVDWDEVPELFGTPTAMQVEALRLRDLHPADAAAFVRALPMEQRRQLAEALDDERLADVLEQLPEDEQIRLVERLDRDRLVGVFDEMEADDLADLLGEMTAAQQERMLGVMDEDDADTVRSLLSYSGATAGGLMTPDVIILPPTATVAEALAQVRRPDWVVSLAAQVFVCRAPYKAPTGTFLGVAHMQRLLREPPAMELRHCLREAVAVGPEASDREVAEHLASYDLLAVAVCDEAGRLLGAVTVDDVIDRMLGRGWRRRRDARVREEADDEAS